MELSLCCASSAVVGVISILIIPDEAREEIFLNLLLLQFFFAIFLPRYQMNDDKLRGLIMAENYS